MRFAPGSAGASVRKRALATKIQLQPFAPFQAVFHFSNPNAGGRDTRSLRIGI
jgi:hypothetical protein